jgi:hypothetical protein
MHEDNSCGVAACGLANTAAMPLRWAVEPERKFIAVRGEGDVTYADVVALLDAMLAAGTRGYRKLVDISGADTSMTRDELLMLGVRVRGVHGLGKMGPLALVLPRSGATQAEMFFGMIAAADRPLRIFRDSEEAADWIKRQASVAD